MTHPIKFTVIDPKILQKTGAAGVVLPNPSLQVYTNRDLNLEQIELVGFDMDYTLARYHRLPIEQLQYDLTRELLIATYGYPEEIRNLSYDPHLTIRGLVVDKWRGHLIKMDMNGRVWRAMHGHRQLTDNEIQEIYHNTKIKMNSSQFISLDTLFAMPEACLYQNLVEFFETKHALGESLGPVTLEQDTRNPTWNRFDTEKLFDNVRTSIDKIHSDDSLKSMITQDLAKYIEKEPELALTLHKIRSSGKRLFLLTNSHYVYTEALMSYLLNNELPEYTSWRSYFDIIIVASQKPDFFAQEKPFYELRESDGYDETSPVLSNDTVFDRSKIYVGGNILDFERRAGCRGENILYVGDHIYGDIVRSKKESLWRTCLVVEEIESEIQLSVRWAFDIDRISAMESDMMSIDAAIGHHRVILAHLESYITRHEEQQTASQTQAQLIKIAKNLRREIDIAKRAVKDLDRKIMTAQDEIERRFHPYWGRLFREHSELSRFGNQVTSYACIYTSRVSNLLQYSPVHSFRSVSELMSHDRTLQNAPQIRKAKIANLE